MSEPTRQPTPADRPLRIGIDATSLGSGRGYGRFLGELLPPLLASPHEFVLFVDRDTRAAVAGLPARCVEPSTSSGQAGAASARGNRALRDVVAMGRAVAGERLDCVFFPSVYSFFPVPSRVPVVVAFHDTIPERHGHVVFPTRRNRWLWNAKVRLALLQARLLLTVSEWSKRALIEQFSVAPERVAVAVEAPAAAFVPTTDPEPRAAWLRKHGLDEDVAYLIYVGGFNPHKNLDALVDAVAAQGDGGAAGPLHLLLVGDFAGDLFHADVDALRAHIGRAGLEARVHFPGFVPDDELRHLYAGACALVLPSLEEGFGLPAVEAAACGTPCVATECSPLPELLAGGGLFVDPRSADALRDALARIVGESGLRERLGAVALSRAQTLSWDATALATRTALERAAGASR